MTATSSGSQHVTTGAWVEHTGDGTLVHDTERDDTQMQQALGDAGFRWSRNLNAAYLPRPWRFETRSQRVRQLVAALEDAGRTIRVDESRERQRTSAEIEDERVERAVARAERLDERAARRSEESAAKEGEARARLDGWPLGQPLVGSPARMRSQRNFLDRQHAKLDKADELDREARDAQRGAATARDTARKNESPALIARRLAKQEAERRDIGRRIAGTHSPWAEPATGEYLDRLQVMAADLDERVEWNRQTLADAEQQHGRLWTPQDIRVGDEVRVRGHWYPVKRVNKKTVTVTPLVDLGADMGRSWADTVPYNKIKGRRRDGVETRHPETEKE